MKTPDLHSPQISRLTSIVILFVLLAVTWLVWSGIFKSLLLFLGLVSSVICLWLALRMRFFDDYLFSLPVGMSFLGYLIWLTREVIKSSLAVAKIVLSPSLPISPRVARIRADSEHPYDQVLFANSITLTPGTITIFVNVFGTYTVHAIDKHSAEALPGKMEAKVERIFKN